MGFWSGFARTAAEIDHDGHRYRVELRLMAAGRNVTLYRDGAEVARASTPARFDISGGVIEVDASEHGFNRAILRHHGATTRMRPAAGTWEAARERWHREHPTASRAVASAATVIVMLSLVVALMELLELVTAIPALSAMLGWSFTSPIDLPPVAVVIIGVVAGAAALERALRMR